MISRKYRFHGRGSLNYAYKKGSSVRGQYLALRFVGNNRADYRLAVVVSRKVSKSAVVRNRIRRRMYEIVRLAHADSGVPWPYDLVMTVFDEQVSTMPPETLRSTITGLLNKSKVIG